MLHGRFSRIFVAGCILLCAACSSQLDADTVIVEDSSTTRSIRKLSPAWRESVALHSPDDDSVPLTSLRRSNDYILGNPNEISTPMGALCWVVHEIYRTQVMALSRDGFDYVHIPFVVEKLALVNDLLPAEGPERSIAVLSLLEAGPGGEEPSQVATAGESDDRGETPVTEPGEATGPYAVNDEELAFFYTDEYVQSMRLWNAAGGTGEE